MHSVAKEWERRNKQRLGEELQLSALHRLGTRAPEMQKKTMEKQQIQEWSMHVIPWKERKCCRCF